MHFKQSCSSSGSVRDSHRLICFMFCHLAFHSQKKEREREREVREYKTTARPKEEKMDETEIILLAERRAKENVKSFTTKKHTRSMHESKSRPIVPNTQHPPRLIKRNKVQKLDYLVFVELFSSTFKE